MRILVINGNTKADGFIAGALRLIEQRLAAKGAQVSSLPLAEANILDCRGCFHCLKTGSCLLKDDMNEIIRRMLEADGFVIGSPVRNGLVTACYKRFYERITYRLGFPLRIEDKHTLALSAVGFAGGKAVNRKALGLQDVFHTNLSAFLFFRVGIPRHLEPAQERDRLERAADKLVRDIESRRQKGLFARIAASFDRFIVHRFMMTKSPEQYAYVIKCWKEKGYIK